MSLLFPSSAPFLTVTNEPNFIAPSGTASLLPCVPAPTMFASKYGAITQQEERPLVPDNYSYPLFNDFGYVVRAKADTGEDLLLWMFMYRQLGPDTIVDADLGQTAFVVVNMTDSEKAAMHDTPYLNQGQNLDDYYEQGSLQFEESDNDVRWHLANRSFVSSPPLWKAGGEHGGVEVHLDMTQRGDFYYHIGNFDTFDNDVGNVGGIIHVRVNGTVTANNKTYTITNGHAIHERIIMAGEVSPRLDYMSGRGAQWINSWGDRLSFFIFQLDLESTSQFMMNLDNTTMVVEGLDYASVEVLDSWLDPKTNQINPRSWRIKAVTPLGKLESTITAYGRYYYTWIRREGGLLVHCYVADAETTFTTNDGTVIKEKHVAMNEFMRTLYDQAQTNKVG